jgi:hypothetical protein
MVFFWQNTTLILVCTISQYYRFYIMQYNCFNAFTVVKRNFLYLKVMGKIYSCLVLMAVMLLPLSSAAAEKYWVNGSGSWNNPVSWSHKSGGAGGAGVPSASDIVIFDANSGDKHGFTVDVPKEISIQDLTVKENTPPLVFSSNTASEIYISRNLDIKSNFTDNINGKIIFNAKSGTQANIFSQSVFNSSLSFNGKGVWNFQSNIGTKSVLDLMDGEVFTNNYQVSADSIQIAEFIKLNIGESSFISAKLRANLIHEENITSVNSEFVLTSDEIYGNLYIPDFFFERFRFISNSFAERFEAGIDGKMDVTFTHPTCETSTDGTVTITAISGTPPFRFLMNSFDGGIWEYQGDASSYSHTFTGISLNGNSTLRFVTALYNGPAYLDQLLITLNRQSSFTASVAQVSGVGCNGEAVGALEANHSPGAAPIVYAWSSGGNGKIESGLGEGTFTVTVTDDRGCYASASRTLVATPVVASHTINKHVTCKSGADGAASLSATGGAGGYTYAWSDGGSGNSRSDLTAQTYTVTVSDSEACIDVVSFTIAEPALGLSLSHVINSHVNCTGGNDGNVSLTAANGTTPYSYSWSDGGTGASRNNLIAGNFTVTVSDANSCQAQTSFTISQPAGGVTASISVEEDVLCFGGTEGELLASASGGTGPYTFTWSDGGTGAARAGLAAGSYTVTAADANGCEATAAESLAEPGLLTLTVIKDNDATCNGSCDGAAVALTNGGTWPFSFVWSNGAASPGTNTLCAGIAVVTVTDANSCQATGQAVIGQPDVLQASVSSQSPASCAGVADGSAALAATGGTSPYTYSWSGGGTGATRADLAAGSYTVSLTDSESCEDIITVTITEPAPIALAINGQADALCAGSADGTADVSASGGTSPYTYTWSDGGTGASRNDLSAGTYTVTAADANSCQIDIAVIIGEPAGGVTASISVEEDVLCFGGTEGELLASASGGTAHIHSLGATAAPARPALGLPQAAIP